MIKLPPPSSRKWTILVVALLFTACMRDSVPRRLELFIEPMGAKMALHGTNGTWSDGDSVMVNGQAVAINCSGEQAYIANVTSADVYRAFYPTPLAQGAGNSDAVTVALPREYSYRTDAHGQLLPLPMAARSTGDNLQFKHLTGAICFTLKNERTDHPVTIDRITVSSSAYQLSGNREIDLTALATLGPIATADAIDRQVDITFTHQSLVIAVGDSQQVVVPVAPVGADNRFTVTVTSHYQGIRHVYTKTQTTGGALARNQMAYAKIALGNSMISNSLFEGYGQDLNPFLISSPTDFLLMAEAISSNWVYSSNSYKYKQACYRITQDIDLDGITIHPIVDYRTGIIDGQNHTISNFTIASTGTNNNDTCALFRNISQCTIKNLKLSHLTLSHNNSSSYLFLSALCAVLTNSTIKNCEITNLSMNIAGNITTAYFGGFATQVTPKDTLDNCTINFTPSFSISASSSFWFGNLIGGCNEGVGQNVIIVSNCHATNPSLSLQTSSAFLFGGLVGRTRKTYLTIEDCTYQGSGTLISSNSYIYAGGLVGAYYYANPSSLTLSGCTVSGAITYSGNNNSNCNPYYGNASASTNLTISSCSSSLIFSSAAK